MRPAARLALGAVFLGGAIVADVWWTFAGGGGLAILLSAVGWLFADAVLFGRRPR